jgi:hypothetical protein
MKQTLKSSKKLRFPSPGAIEDEWQRRATAVAIEQARAVVSGGAVPPMMAIGRLSNTEWGWIVAAALFGWISTRAAQATNNGVGMDAYIRTVAIEPDPWLAGAVAAILPELAKREIDWSKSLSGFSRGEMTDFLIDPYTLISKAIICRDKGENLVTADRRIARGRALAGRDGKL